MQSFTIKDVQLDGQTRLENGVLFVNPDELRGLAMEDGAFSDVLVEIARPGERTRTVHVIDASEARHKPGFGTDFPGFVGPMKTVGEGKTDRLTGMAIVATGEAVAGESTYWREALIDMSGPGAEVSPFGSMLNLVLSFQPHGEYLRDDGPDAEIENMMYGSPLAQRYHRRIRTAELKVSAHLAGVAAEASPDDIEIFELTRPYVSLPRVVYFWQGSFCVYGQSSPEILPTLIHPNEILDGAVVNIRSNSHAGHRDSTFFNLSHAIVRDLYSRHGKDLDFAGVVIYPMASDDLATKERMAEYATKLARILGAEGAISSYAGGGHPAVEFMLICQKCEQEGIKTVLVMPEAYGTPEDPGFVYSVPEAVAITSTGRGTQKVELPAMETVLGGDSFFDLDATPWQSLHVPYRYVYGSMTNTGYAKLAAREY